MVVAIKNIWWVQIFGVFIVVKVIFAQSPTTTSSPTSTTTTTMLIQPGASVTTASSTTTTSTFALITVPMSTATQTPDIWWNMTLWGNTSLPTTDSTTTMASTITTIASNSGAVVAADTTTPKSANINKINPFFLLTCKIFYHLLDLYS